jgi:hypothetical protein
VRTWWALAATTLTLAGIAAGSAAADTAAAPTPASSDFASSLTSLYATLYQTVQAVDGKTGGSRSQQLPDPARFSQEVGRLSSENLARLHEATVRQGHWDQLAPDTRQLLAAAQSAATSPQARSGGGAGTSGPSPAPASKASARPRAAATAQTAQAVPGATASFPPDEPVGSFPAPPATFAPSLPVDPFVPITCASNGNPYPYYVASDTAIFIGKTVAAVADAAYNIVPTLAPAFLEESFVDPAKIVAAVVESAANLAVSALEDAQQSAEDCDLVNQTGYSANSDNSTVNGFALETQNQLTIGAIEASVNTLHDQVHVVAQSLGAELTTEIQQALTLPGTAPADVYYELPASAGGNLDSSPVGVQAVVTSAYQAAKQAGLPVNATATNNLTAANQALAARNYRTAWADYQTAYQALG